MTWTSASSFNEPQYFHREARVCSAYNVIVIHDRRYFGYERSVMFILETQAVGKM